MVEGSKLKNLLVNIYIKLFKLGHNAGCHQLRERSFFIKGWQFPVCARCLGILLGQIVGIILLISNVMVSFYISISFLLIMFLDWYIQYISLLKSTNLRRLITGTLAGIGEVSIILIILRYLLSILLRF